VIRHEPVHDAVHEPVHDAVHEPVHDAVHEPVREAVDPFAPARLGPVAVRNRIVKSATFEGLTRDHVVTDELIEFHRRVAAGGVGMTTLAFCAVAPDGCGTPNELILTPKVTPGLARFAEAIHAEGAAVSAQLGHAGAVAAGTGLPGLSPSPVFSPLAMKRTKGVTVDQIHRIIGEFARGARLLADAGFDAVEIHLGHGYLPSEFLSPRLNRRTDEWGGSLENRARFPRAIATAVREAVGDRLAVLAKLNMADGVRGGLWLDESVEVGRLLEADGALDAIELTAGSSLQNPMYLFRGEAPVAEMARVMPRPIRPAFRLAGRAFLREYPYEEAYLLPYARQFRAALRMPLILLGGINRLETVHQAMAEGFEFVAMARALLREPDLVARWQRGATHESLCVHCNKCMATIYRGTRCVLVP
jgi:2,4-dienoyl-CoA reductase-like NADH-dependent reductase (Old Yellow Enzyme family)